MDINGACALAEQLGCGVSFDVPLSEHCTFRTGGVCSAMIEVASEQALAKLAAYCKENGVRYFVLGKGSNVLFDDRGFEGIILHIAGGLSAISLVGEDMILAGAGANLIKVCAFALENSLSGMEFAYGIPGSVGGAVFMNAGAYGGEIRDIIAKASAVTADGGFIEVDSRDMQLGYRHSCFMENGDVVTSALFKLKKGDKAEIKARMEELMGRRREKQPLEYPSAGSTFKRPEGKFAGKLIQDSGLRGFSIGGAQVSEKHCGFVINKDGAATADVLALIKHIQKTVLEKTGTELECEVRYIPYSE